MIVFFNFLFPFTTENLADIHCVTLTHAAHTNIAASVVFATKCDLFDRRNSVVKTI